MASSDACPSGTRGSLSRVQHRSTKMRRRVTAVGPGFGRGRAGAPRSELVPGERSRTRGSYGTEPEAPVFGDWSRAEAQRYSPDSTRENSRVASLRLAVFILAAAQPLGTPRRSTGGVPEVPRTTKAPGRDSKPLPAAENRRRSAAPRRGSARRPGRPDRLWDGRPISSRRAWAEAGFVAGGGFPRGRGRVEAESSGKWPSTRSRTTFVAPSATRPGRLGVVDVSSGRGRGSGLASPGRMTPVSARPPLRLRMLAPAARPPTRTGRLGHPGTVEIPSVRASPCASLQFDSPTSILH